jgi:hypothetical protein
VVRRVRSLSPATRAICHATASEDAIPDPLSRIRRKLDRSQSPSTRNAPQPVRKEMIDSFYEQTEVLAREDIGDGVAYMVTRSRHSGIGELWTTPTEQL